MLVNLIRAHHDVAPAPGQCLENPTERHPALDGAGGAQRRGVGQQLRFTVGQHDIR